MFSEVVRTIDQRNYANLVRMDQKRPLYDVKVASGRIQGKMSNRLLRNSC